ncbi:hypothetical protein ACETU7_31080 [Rhodococcus sp. 3Y1]
MDDGSTDSTAALCRAHDIRVLTQPNAGAYLARRRGPRSSRHRTSCSWTRMIFWSHPAFTSPCVFSLHRRTAQSSLDV